MSVLSEILSSKVRAEVFRHLFGLDEKALHVREIERRSGFVIGDEDDLETNDKQRGMCLLFSSRPYCHLNTIPTCSEVSGEGL